MAQTRTFKIFYNHGQGGSSEVTRGTIDIQRRNHIDADIIWLQHKHKLLMMEMDPYWGVSTQSNFIWRKKTGIITGCFKQRFRKYDIEKTGYQLDYGEQSQRVPQNCGAAFIKLKYVANKDIEHRVAM